MNPTPQNREQRRRAAAMTSTALAHAERQALAEHARRMKARPDWPLLELRLATAERAALAAFPIEKLAPNIRVIERIIAFDDDVYPQCRSGPRVLAWAALIVAGNRQGAAALMQKFCPWASFDDSLWRALEATQPLTADRETVGRVVDCLVALGRTCTPEEWPKEAEFRAWATPRAEQSRLRMKTRIEAARAGVGGLRLIRVDEQWSTIRDPEGLRLILRLIWNHMGRPFGTWEAAVEAAQAAAAEQNRPRPHVARAPEAEAGGPSLKHIRDDSERALILAEEGGVIAESEDDVRASAIWGVRDTAMNAARWRTRAYVINAEKYARTQFELRPKVEQQKILRDAVLALHRLLTDGFLRPVLPKRFPQRELATPFPYRGLSVRPRDLHSGVHVGDALHLLQQHPRLWRLVVREGVTTGALWFEEREGVAVTLASTHWWWPGYPFDPSEPKAKREINACLAAMDEPYPETLPDSFWLESDCGTGVRIP
jgi:hypothetical protein